MKTLGNFDIAVADEPQRQPIDCGCRLEHTNATLKPHAKLCRIRFEYCALHAAAPDLLAALSATVPEMLRVASLGHMVGRDEAASLQRAVEDARTAIKEAKS